MALQNTDLFIVERAGVQYKMASDQIADFIGAVRDLTAVTYNDMLADSFIGGQTAKVGDKVFIADASDDPSVDTGYAGYRVDSVFPITVTKIYEQESMDLVINTPSNLGYTPTPNQGTITNDNGTAAVIPIVNVTNAGLATPQMFADTHIPATTGLTAGANPINISGQELTFGIDQLTPLP